jgi:hypothetical protein
MNMKEAVAAAELANREWMRTHLGIVDFILSECEAGGEGNDPYDDIILANPEEARAAAKFMDAEGRPFQAQISLSIPLNAWERAYGTTPDAAGVKEFLENALFVSTDHVAVSVNSIVDESE